MRTPLLFVAVGLAAVTSLGGCSDPASPTPPNLAAPMAFGAQIRDRLDDQREEAEARKERLDQQILNQAGVDREGHDR